MEPKQTRAQKAKAAVKSPWVGAVLALMAALTSYLKAHTNTEEIERTQQHGQRVQTTLTDNEAGLAKSANSAADALTMLYQHEAEERARLALRLEQVEQELLRLKAPPATPVTAPSSSRRRPPAHPQPDRDADGVADQPDPPEDLQAKQLALKRVQEAAQHANQAFQQKILQLPLRPKLKVPEQMQQPH